jgi:G3E family GTPase
VLALRPGARLLPHEAGPPGDEDPLVRLVIDPESYSRPAPPALPPARTIGHARFGVRQISSRGVHRLAALEDYLAALPPSVFRAKGIVRVEDGWVRFHAVGGRVDLVPDVAPPAHGTSRLVLFGRELREADLSGLRAAGFAPSVRDPL